jgi:hypothetical protein
VGAVVGAAVASSASSDKSQAAYAQGYNAGATNTAAATTTATTTAYAQGYNAGVTTATVAYTTGQIVATVPAGCAQPVVQGVTYYLCGNTWFLPSYGANGVYYKVVPTP